MTTRTAGEVYADLTAAGFTPAAAQVMTAIAQAESGLNDTILGDTALQDGTWGPSYGLFQIRTLAAQTGTGGTRDISRLAAGDLEQARAAYTISHGGSDFTPWTTFRTGAYQDYLGATTAPTAAAGGGGDGGGPAPTLGPWWLPWNIPSDVINAGAGAAQDAAGTVFTGARHILLEGLALILGLGLAGAGLYLLTSRSEHRLLAPARRLVWGR